MFFIEFLLASVIHLAVIGLDVIGFFVVIRVLALRWSARPLLALDRVGGPVTDPLIEAVTRAIPCHWMTGEKRRKHVAAAATLLVLSLCRLALAGLVACEIPNVVQCEPGQNEAGAKCDKEDNLLCVSHMFRQVVQPSAAWPLSTVRQPRCSGNEGTTTLGSSRATSRWLFNADAWER